MGRLTIYDAKAHPILIKSLSKQGLSSEQIAEEIGIGLVTLYKWASKYPDFKKAWEEGREFPNAKVVNSLYKRCTGYEYEEIVEEIDPQYAKQVKRNSDGTPRKLRGKPKAPRMIVVKRIKKHVPPSDSALQYWLNNKLPKQWTSKQDINMDLSANIVSTAVEMSAEERIAWLKAHGFVKSST